MEKPDQVGPAGDDRAAGPGASGAPTRISTIVLVAALAAACASGRGGPRAAGPGEEARPPEGPGAETVADAPLVGGCGAAPSDLVPRYRLPFPAGREHTLTQGNCGAASHGGRFRYSFDFEMPIGTPVIAARDGVVETVRDDRPDGTRRLGDENFVIIRHDDGELSRYIHLTRGGALVEEGERVAAGDTIARSGDSGRSAFPHLHFDVSDRCGFDGCHTIPSAFLNADPPIPMERAPVLAEPPEDGAP